MSVHWGQNRQSSGRADTFEIGLTHTTSKTAPNVVEGSGGRQPLVASGRRLSNTGRATTPAAIRPQRRLSKPAGSCDAPTDNEG